ncbi:MAG TPA: PA14 domain-containing protein [Bryobacteraceae bacterium]|nr:PA14 domain-containing protein [Bryobacteraceae bacterium]
MAYFRPLRSVSAIILSIIASGLVFAQAPATCPGAATGAFTACYYNNTSLAGTPALIRTDPLINFIWGTGTPDRSITPMNFSAAWQGNFTFNQGAYTFTVMASDGIRLYVDGQSIIDRWQDQAVATYSASVYMTQGSHLVVVRYFEQTGSATARVIWSQNVPTTQPPAIASFTATPSVVTAGQAVTLSWNVTGASSVSLDNQIGIVRGGPPVTVYPAETTTYTLTATNGAATSTAAVKVVVNTGRTQPPTAPTLVSAKAKSASEVDLTWTASTDSKGIAGYQVLRNGAVAASLPGSALSWSDTSVSAQTVYTYTVKAYDTASVYSAASNAIQVTTPPANQTSLTCPAPATNAFTGCYFNNTSMAGAPTFVRNDPSINFYWGNGSPDKSLSPMNFSGRWQGNFSFASGSYTFTAIASDGIRVLLDGTAIVDKWQDEAPSTWTAAHAVSQGTHLIEVDYYERTGQATAQVSWAASTPAANLPVISSFTATPSSTTPGQPVTLAWNVSNATTVSVDAFGDMRGRSSVIVWPTQTTTYTLSASGAGGTSSAAVTVTIRTAADTQPPTAPKLVSATAPGPSAVNLSWTASSDNVGVAGYQIVRNGSAVSTVSASTLSWSDTAVTAGSVYTYAVKAFDSAGNYSASSNTIQVTIPTPASAPVIQSFTATPAATTAGKSVTLAWVVTGATSLSINQGVGTVTNSSSKTVSPSATTTYTLSASNSSGTKTASVTVTITQGTDKQAPTAPVLVTVAANGPNEVDLAWNASTDNVGVAGYQITRNGAVISTVGATTGTWADSTVTPNTAYSYSVKAFDAAGNYSVASNVMQVTTPAAPTLSVTWYGACWEHATIYGVTGNFQAIDFSLTTSTPVPLQGTLFFAANCSATNGQDNMNDYGTTISGGHMLQGFSHHPDVIPSSAEYWFGPLTQDGKCPAGAPCSGCVNYTSTTLSCDLLP